MANGMIRNVLITGGAGFIGSNLAERLLSRPGTHVCIFDNLSRPGAASNLDWLRSIARRGQLDFVLGDTRNSSAVRKAAAGVAEIYHLAAQVAVTTSLDDPRSDFEVNALGTLNVLEAARLSRPHPFLLFTSTNKVYGSLPRVPVLLDGEHYRARDPRFRGVDERELLDFHSPYGCSKGAADQYVRDYARIYGVPSVVFRMSCIAGPRQFGNEHQGWVAHFLYAALAGETITVYGDGFQVRDILHVHDLIDAMEAVRFAIDRTRGQIYNVGGGPERAASVTEMLRLIERSTGKRLALSSNTVRPGDQPLYISDTGKLAHDTGWRPRRSINDTLGAIQDFWNSNRSRILEIRNRHATEPEILASEVA